MRNNGTCLFVVICFIVWSVRSSSIRRAVIWDDVYCDVDVGTPALGVPLRLSTALSGVVLLEDPCAVVPVRCAPVCADEDFGPLVCPPECLPEKQRRWAQDCAVTEETFDNNYYNRSESTTHAGMRGEWTAQRGDFWKAAGGLVLDRLHLHDNWTGGDDTPQVFAVESAQLMVGKLVNYFTFDYETSGFLGLAPGEHNLVVQAFNQGLIPAPIVASVPIDGYGQQMLYFGGLPGDAPCTNWSQFPTFENKWMFRADTMEIFGLTYTNPIIHFSAETVDHEPVFLSDEIIQRALRAGALSVYRTYENSYRTNCSGTIEARVRAGDQEFAFSIASDWDGKSSCDLYIGRISFFGAWNHDVAYTNTPTVIFPLSFNENCLVYDYANQTISLAES